MIETTPEAEAWCKETTELSEALRLLNSDLVDVIRRLERIGKAPGAPGRAMEGSYPVTVRELLALYWHLERLYRVLYDVADNVGQGSGDSLTADVAKGWRDHS